MNIDTLNKIKRLLGEAGKLSGFHEMFAEKFRSDERCDKKGYGFGRDNRFAAISLSVSFDSWAGYYGNSGCSSVLSLHDDVKPFLIKALNVHQKEIFSTAARLMREEAEGLTAKAREEIAALQSMVDALGPANDAEKAA